MFTAVWYQPVELHLTGKTSKPGKTRENNLTNEVAPRSEYEVGTGTLPPPSQVQTLASWCCALWDSVESHAFLFTSQSYFNWGSTCADQR